jgi:hypothetical protein
MTNLKGMALVMVGIIVFSGSCIYASELYDRPSSQVSTGLEAKAWDILQDIRESEALVSEGLGAGLFDPQKVLTVQAKDLETEDLEFRLEIIDVSGREDVYSRSIAKGDAIQTSEPPMVVEEGKLVELHSAASIFVGPDDVHGARMVLMVWED